MRRVDLWVAYLHFPITFYTLTITITSLLFCVKKKENKKLGFLIRSVLVNVLARHKSILKPHSWVWPSYDWGKPLIVSGSNDKRYDPFESQKLDWYRMGSNSLSKARHIFFHDVICSCGNHASPLYASPTKENWKKLNRTDSWDMFLMENDSPTSTKILIC